MATVFIFVLLGKKSVDKPLLEYMSKKLNTINTFKRCPIVTHLIEMSRMLLEYMSNKLNTINTFNRCPIVTHLIEMSRMSANYVFGKTAKCDQKSFFARFQILMEMGLEICL